jgi:hypothetical protein
MFLLLLMLHLLLLLLLQLLLSVLTVKHGYFHYFRCWTQCKQPSKRAQLKQPLMSASNAFSWDLKVGKNVSAMLCDLKVGRGTSFAISKSAKTCQ